MLYLENTYIAVKLLPNGVSLEALFLPKVYSCLGIFEKQ